MADNSNDMMTHGLQLIHDGRNVMSNLKSFLPQATNNIYVVGAIVTIIIKMGFAIIFLSFISSGAVAATNAASASYTYNSTDDTHEKDEKKANQSFIQGQIFSSCCYFLIIFVYIIGFYQIYHQNKLLQFDTAVTTNLPASPSPSPPPSLQSRLFSPFNKNKRSKRSAITPTAAVKP
jgi:hypothetical protein